MASASNVKHIVSHGSGIPVVEGSKAAPGMGGVGKAEGGGEERGGVKAGGGRPLNAPII